MVSCWCRILALTLLVAGSLRVVHAAPDAIDTAYWSWSIALGVVMLLVVYYLWSRGRSDDMAPLNRFVAKHLELGFPATTIRDALVSRGWPPQMVMRALAAQEISVSVPVVTAQMDDPYNPLREYISSRLHQSDSILMIRERLLKVGWEEQIIHPFLVRAVRAANAEHGAHARRRIKHY